MIIKNLVQYYRDFHSTWHLFFEKWTNQTLKWISYNSRRPQWVTLWSAKNRKLKLQSAQVHQNWSVWDGKIKPGPMNLIFWSCTQMLWQQQHKSLDPLPCVGNTVGNVFLVHFSHSLVTAYLSIASDDVHPFMPAIYSSSNGYIQHNTASCHIAKVITNWFQEQDNALNPW